MRSSFLAPVVADEARWPKYCGTSAEAQGRRRNITVKPGWKVEVRCPTLASIAAARFAGRMRITWIAKRPRARLSRRPRLLTTIGDGVGDSLYRPLREGRDSSECRTGPQMTFTIPTMNWCARCKSPHQLCFQRYCELVVQAMTQARPLAARTRRDPLDRRGQEQCGDLPEILGISKIGRQLREENFCKTGRFRHAPQQL